MALPYLDKKSYTITLNSEDRLNAYTPTIATNPAFSFTGSVTGNQLTVTAGTSSTNVLGPGSVITGTGIIITGTGTIITGAGVVPNTYIVSGTSSPFTLNNSFTIASGTLTSNGLTSSYCNIYSSSIPSGFSSRNNGTFNIDWSQILPREYDDYKIAFSFGTAGGKYLDVSGGSIYSSAKVYVDFGSKSYNYDTSYKSAGTMLGLIYRDIQSSTSSSNALSCYYLYNPPRTITRPQSNFITVKIINQYSGIGLTDTSSTGVPASDMTQYTMMIEIIAIEESKSISNLL